MSQTESTQFGVLLVNLGTPEAPTTPAVRRYLAQFLSDQRVVDTPRLLWWCILHGVILRFRPARAAKAYQKIWQATGSPLLTIARQQQHALTQALATAGTPVPVALGMTYGNPSIADALTELQNKGVKRILVLPLYPQYSSSTTASVFDAVAKALKNTPYLPELRFIQQYHDHPLYIQALAHSIREYRQQHGVGDQLLLSFHGIPQRYEDKGDPYPSQCRETAALVAEALGLSEKEWRCTFQSRFGREEWVKPYTDKVLEEWAHAQIQRVDVVSPAFSADCLETLEELDMENRHLFLQEGGKDYHYIPCLNDRPEHIQLLTALVQQHSQGWTPNQQF